MRWTLRLFFGLLLVTAILALPGCSSDKGSREYTPGKGWTPA